MSRIWVTLTLKKLQNPLFCLLCCLRKSERIPTSYRRSARDKNRPRFFWETSDESAQPQKTKSVIRAQISEIIWSINCSFVTHCNNIIFDHYRSIVEGDAVAVATSDDDECSSVSSSDSVSEEYSCE